MKKLSSFIMVSLVSMISLFGATVSFERKLPAELDLSPAKTIAYAAVETFSPKRGDAYTREQATAGEKFLKDVAEYQAFDGRFTTAAETNADIVIKLRYTDFSVKDDGVTITQDVDGETVTVKDEWTRTVSATLEFSVIKGKKVVTTKEIHFFDANSSPVAKSMLNNPSAILDKNLGNYTYVVARMIFDTRYQQAVTIMDSKSKDKTVKNKMKEAQKLLKGKGKDYDKAREIYKEVYEANPEDPAAAYDYAIMLQVAKDFEQAEAILTKLQTADAKNKTYKKALEDLQKDKTETEILNSRK